MKIKVFILSLVMFFGLNSFAVVQTVPQTKQNAKPVTQAQVVNYTPVKSLDVVANPSKYLNKKIKIKAKFDKFSTLGLDYSKAMRSSEKYIGFLIKRDDTTNNIPLSEMKIFMKRSEAEKYIDFNSRDIVELTGEVISNA